MSVHANGLKPESESVTGAPGSASGRSTTSSSGNVVGGGPGGGDCGAGTTSNGTVISSSPFGCPGWITVQCTVRSCMPAANVPSVNVCIQ